MGAQAAQTDLERATCPRIDYTSKDYAALREALLALAHEKLPEWRDLSPNDPGVVLLELFAYMGDILLYYQDRIANESYLDTAVEPRSVMNLLRLIGYELRPPQPASVDLTLLLEEKLPDGGATQVTIPTGTIFQTPASSSGQAVTFAYIRDDLQLNLANLPIEKYKPDDKQYRVYRYLPLVQVDATVATPEEILGSSDGSAGQRFSLSRGPLIDASLRVMVDGVAWEKRSTLLHSHSADRHYMVRRDETGAIWVEFGDGIYGQIPSRGRNNVAATYRVGGGTKGNVAPMTLMKLGSSTSILHFKYAFNERAAAGGMDAESSAAAKLRGPQLFRAGGRAVTAADYEAYAREFGVGKVRAQATSWNCVELWVAPMGGGFPSDTLKRDLKAYFDDKRMLTTLVEVRDPVYVIVQAQGRLRIDPRRYPEQVQQRVDQVVGNLLAFESVGFAMPLYLSDFYKAIDSVEGMEYVYIERLARADSLAGPNLPEDGKLAFDRNEIPLGGHLAWDWDSATREWKWRTVDPELEHQATTVQ